MFHVKNIQLEDKVHKTVSGKSEEDWHQKYQVRQVHRTDTRSQRTEVWSKPQRNW